ncbi:MAG: glycosyltransferase [Patescibacteria group bacterium]
MRIGFFTEIYLPHLNGITISLIFAKKELEKRGHQVYIFTPKIAGYKDKENNIIRLRSIAILNPELELKLPISAIDVRKILKLKLDVVHGHGCGLVSILGYELALTKGYPYVFTYHTYLEKYTHYFFLKNKKITNKIAKNSSRFICNVSDLVIVPSQKMKTILQSYKVKKEIIITPNPIDLNSFTKVKSGFLRKKLNIDDEKVILLTVSRLGQEKNIGFLIKSFSKVVKENDQAVLVIVGDGTEQNKLAALSKKLNLEDKVFFTGYIDTKQMPEVYSDADIFVFASTTETQGLVVLEAAACQLPIIAVKDEAFSNVIKDGFNGYLVTEDTNLFAGRTLDLLRDGAKRKQFGINSSQYVREIFDQNKIIKQFEQIYSQAIEIRKNKPRRTLRLRNQVKKFIKLFS